MTDFIDFTEGQNYVLANGLPATCEFLLSTTAVSGFTAASTLAGGVGEITGTGAGRKSQARPAPAGGSIVFSSMEWDTAAATDWPSSVKSIVLVTSADNTGKAICAWNLIAGGAGRDLSQANTSEIVTPTLILQ